MIVTTKELLRKAQKRGYAVGAFNTSDMEMTQAIIDAASELKSPVIVQTSSSAIKYAGLKTISDIVHNLGCKTRVPVALHLDHGKDVSMIKKCLQNKYTSVMIDGSFYPFKKNVEITKKIVRLAKKIPVEAELGKLKGIEDDIKSKNSVYTDPEEAKKFVKLTGISSLAVAIGTSHGAYKFKGKSLLDFKRLKEIKEAISVPLVLHGSSGVPEEITKMAKKYGAKLGNTKGVSRSNVRKAVKLGICKVNIDTDLRLAFTAAIRKQLFENPSVFSPREIIGAARETVQTAVEKKIKLLGSEGEA